MSLSSPGGPTAATAPCLRHWIRESDVHQRYNSSSWRWDTRTWRDVSSYRLTYLPL